MTTTKITRELETKKALAVLIGTVAIGPVSALGSGLYSGYTGQQDFNTLDAIALGHGAVLGGVVAFGPESSRTGVIEGAGALLVLGAMYTIPYGIGLVMGTTARFTL